MGITAGFKILEAAELEMLLEDHSSVEAILSQTDERANQILGDFVSRIESLESLDRGISNVDRQRLFTEAVREIYDDSDRAGFVDIGKTWDLLQVLVTGSYEPDGTILGNFILGGEPIGPDRGYETPRLIYSDLVKQIAEELIKIDFEDKYQSLDHCEENFNLTRWRVSSIRNKAFVKDSFMKVKKMYVSAAEEDLAILAYLN